MLRPSIYTLTSPLHDEKSVEAESSVFVKAIEDSLGSRLEMKGADFSDYGTSRLNLIFVRTGGTEGIFKELYGRLGDGPVRLLASGRSNSLAASMEILSFLRQKGRTGEILHGSPEAIADRIAVLMTVESARAALDGSVYGVIGRPSDWLISSAADYEAIRRKTGIRMSEISMDELLEEIPRQETPGVPGTALHSLTRCRYGKVGEEQFEKALCIYGALKRIVERHGLAGFTLRCFDLLGPVGNTGCLGLAILNSEGTVAGCEGDIPAMLSMAVVRALTGHSGFQANPARLDPSSGDMLFAHCTIPLDMLRDYSYDTHFESGIGVAVHGEMEEGDVTLFKVSGDMGRYYICEARLEGNMYESNLCRTQLLLRTDSDMRYFLTEPIGNHHVIMKGHHAALLKAFMESLPE